jgi:methionine-rich copper-binding protein CopC
MGSVVRSVTMTAASLCLVAVLVTGARAHAIIINSEPVDGGTGPPPHRLLLRFNSRIEKTLCSVTLVGPGHTHILLLHQQAGATGDTLEYFMPALAAGTYQARWKVMSSDVKSP